MDAGYSTTQNVDANVGVGIGLGKSVSSAKVKLNTKVNHENSDAHSATQINADHLNLISKQGTTLNGTQIESNSLNVQTGNGNLNLNAVTNHTNKTNVGVNFSLGGGVKNHQWQPTGGAAGVDVNVVRNETHTGTQVTSQNTTLNVGKNLNLTGSSLNSESTSGTIAGNINLETLSNKTNETEVSLSASGSGKFTAYPKDKWQESAKKDWDNGIIAGVKADIKAKVNVNKKQVNQPAKVVSKTRQPTLKGNVQQRKAPREMSKQINFSMQASTGLKDMMNKARASSPKRK